MEPLQDQIERNNHAVSSAKLQDFLDIVVEMAHTAKVTPELVVEAARVLEMRRANDLYLANGEALDVQIGSINGLLERIASTTTKRPQ